jgi:hypothetical protein
LEEAVNLGRTYYITPETFREAANYVQNKTLTYEGARNFANIKKFKSLIFAEVEIAVKNEILTLEEAVHLGRT